MNGYLEHLIIGSDLSRPAITVDQAFPPVTVDTIPKITESLPYGRKKASDCPFRVDSPEGRAWIKDHCSMPQWEDTKAADRRIAAAGMLPVRSRLPKRPPDPGSPEYLDWLVDGA